ncbi:MAG: ABC transporter ATP-binding protein [Erysipelotrichaceae bacterium]|nr:ABC transporter ATP-binding protein [Erysipelotrichaceae bacterium]
MARRGAFGKPKDMKGTVRRMAGDFKPQSKQLVAVFVLCLISALVSVATPIMLGAVLNDLPSIFQVANVEDKTIITSVNWPYVYQMFGILLGLYLGSALCGWGGTWIIEKVIAVWVYRQREKLKAKLDRLPLSYFDANASGDILARCTNDLDNIGRNFASVYKAICSSVVLFVGGIIAMFIQNWALSLVVLSTMPITLIVVVLIAKRSRKQFQIYRKHYGVLESHIEEDYSGQKILKLFGQEERSLQVFDEVNEVMTEADRKSQWISGFIYPTMRFVYNFGFVAVSVVAGLIDGSNFGDLVAFIMFLNILQSPFQQLGQLAATIQSMAAAAERTYALLDVQEQEPDKEDAFRDPDAIQGRIDFESVSFSYVPEKPLIEDMNIHVEPGEMVALVGPTGAGKTTIVNLLMRFYEVNGGSIKLDGHDIRDYERAALRQSMGMVLQDTWLFSGTIMENIRYGRLLATDEEVIAAAKAAHADHFISTLPGGYDFELNEDGTNISQGQRQLLTIARAIVSEPKIMILDEATSSVDTRTEKAIQDAMEDVMKGRTSFVIAHRLSTIKNAKLILVMNKGKLIEQGTHEELLKKGGFYADLYNAQFLGNNPMGKAEESFS